MEKLEVVLVEPQNFDRISAATGIDLDELQRIYESSLAIGQICLAHIAGHQMQFEFLKEGA